MSSRWISTAILAALCAVSGSLRDSSSAVARPWIDMGVKDDAAFDQPAVSFEVFEQLPGGGKGKSLGPSGSIFGLPLFSSYFILDTGASSIIAMNDAVSDLRSKGYQTVGKVEEQGVAGFSLLDVSAPYYLEVTDSQGSVTPLPATRIMSGQFPELFGISGIVGMPALVGKVVTLDMRDWAQIGEINDLEDLLDVLDLLALDVNINHSLPAGAGHRYSVPIRSQLFELPAPSPSTPDVPPPAAAPLPFLNMSVGFGNKSATGNFVLDTGASISFISSDMAKRIGLDSNNDGVLDASDEQSDGTLPIGGIGGFAEVPVFYIDSFSLLTEQGVDLVWHLEQSLSVLVLDIHPDIDGVLGSELLTSGWLSFSDDDFNSSLGPLQQVHFDFREFAGDGDPGKIYFDLTPSVDTIRAGTIPGDYNGDGRVNAADYTVWRDAYNHKYNAAADGNNNFEIDSGDYAIWRSNVGNVAPQPGTGGLAGVPEPGALFTALLGVALAFGARPRFRSMERDRAIRRVRSASSTTCEAFSCP